MYNIDRGEADLSVLVRERDVESYLVNKLADAGIPCLKFNPDSKVGMPDRLAILPDNRVMWIELKTDNGRLSDIQMYRHKQLMSAGHEVHVVWSKDQADELVSKVQEIICGKVSKVQG